MVGDFIWDGVHTMYGTIFASVLSMDARNFVSIGKVEAQNDGVIINDGENFASIVEIEAGNFLVGEDFISEEYDYYFRSSISL